MKKVNYLNLIIVFLLLFRLYTYFSTQIGLSGDAYGYLDNAEFIRNNFKFPYLSVQPIGYPLILSLLLKSDKLSTAFYIARIQQLMDFAIVITLIYFARITLAKKYPFYFLILSITFALQPFTGTMASSIYTEQMVAFFSFFGLLFLSVGSSNSNPDYSLSIFGALLFGLSSVLRLDIFALNVLIMIVFIIIEKSKGQLKFSNKIYLKGLALRILAFLLIPICILTFQFISTNQFAFVDTSKYYTQGYYRWLSTWPANWKEHSKFAFYSNWGGSEITNYPAKAFDTSQERNDVSNLLARWNKEGYNADIDMGFYKIFYEKRRGNLFRYYILIPIYRMYHFWINLDGGQFYIVPFMITSPLSKFVVLSVIMLRITFIFLFILGFFSSFNDILKKVSTPSFEWLKLFTIISMIYFLLRTFELGALSTLVGAGLMELRFVLSATPFALVVVISGCHSLLSMYWSSGFSENR